MNSGPIKVMLNASHAVAGGGLIYLENIVPKLADVEGVQWVLVAPSQTMSRLKIPHGWIVRAAPRLGFLGLHLWEQTVLPLWARRQGVTVTLCNANYVPLLAPRPIPILHSPVVDGLAQAEWWRDRLYWSALNWMTLLSLRRSAFALTTADHLLDDYGPARSLRREGRSALAPPGIPSVPRAIARDMNLVVAVGDLHRHKDYPTLLHAFAAVLQLRPQTRLEIIGRPISRAEIDTLRALITRLSIDRAVTLTGQLPHDQVLVRIAEASAFVSTSLAETSNMVIIEAMAVGTPVIVSDLRFQRQVAATVARFVPTTPDRSAAFCEAILSVLNDPALQEQMRASGARRASDFDWKKTALSIIDAIKIVAGR